MQFSIFGALKSALGSSWSKKEREREAAAIQQEEHAYARGDITARGPCPGLNALANQGFLPRDGMNITLPRVEAALMTALHMDATLAHALAGTLKPLVRADGTFDLVDMRKHNVIEHDASFTRLNYRDGDNYTFQPHLFRALLADAGPPGADAPVTIRTLAKSYRRRQRESKASGAPGLPLKLWFVNLVQTVSFLHTAETGGQLSPEVMTEFYTQERFPEVITANPATRKLRGLVGNTLTLLYHIVFDAGA